MFTLNSIRKVALKIYSIVESIETRIGALYDTEDDIEEKKQDIRSTLHDPNIVSFTVSNTDSGTVTYKQL